MSDPRYTDPRYADPRRNGDPLPPRRLDLEAPSSAGSMWTWLAALVAIIIVLGLAIGYNRDQQASTPINPPTTTGAAPSTPRPAAPTNPGGAATQPTPAAPATTPPQQATPTPANPGPSDGAR